MRVFPLETWHFRAERRVSLQHLSIELLSNSRAESIEIRWETQFALFPSPKPVPSLRIIRGEQFHAISSTIHGFSPSKSVRIRGRGGCQDARTQRRAPTAVAGRRGRQSRPEPASVPLLRPPGPERRAEAPAGGA